MNRLDVEQISPRPARRQDLSIFESGPTSQSDMADNPAEQHTFERRPAAARAQILRPHKPGRMLIDNHICRELRGEMEDPSRVGVHSLYQIVQGQPAILDGAQPQPQSGLQAGETWRWLWPVLLGRRVWSVIGGKAIDHCQVLPQGVLIVAAGEPWADLAPPRPEVGKILLSEKHVMGRDFA